MDCYNISITGVLLTDESRFWSMIFEKSASSQLLQLPLPLVTILAKQDSSFMLWAPLILACCFYLIAFYATGRRERPDQVIALLELVIRHERTRFSNRASEQYSSGNTINSNGCFNNF